MTSVAALSAIFREKKLVSIRIKATDYFHNIFRSRLSDPIGLFRNASVHEFYTLKALITLEQVISSVVNKKNKVNEQNFDGEANWSGVVNFHCMPMSPVMGMRFVMMK